MPPKIIICDHLFALLGGIARFIAGEVDLKSFIDKSFSIISVQSTVTLKTYIRVDYVQVMKFTSNWNCVKESILDVKKFYLKLIFRLIMCTTLKHAESLTQNILITSSSMNEGFTDDNLNYPTENEKSKIFLKKKTIAGMDEF